MNQTSVTTWRVCRHQSEWPWKTQWTWTLVGWKWSQQVNERIECKFEAVSAIWVWNVKWRKVRPIVVPSNGATGHPARLTYPADGATRATDRRSRQRRDVFILLTRRSNSRRSRLEGHQLYLSHFVNCFICLSIPLDRRVNPWAFVYPNTFAFFLWHYGRWPSGQSFHESARHKVMRITLASFRVDCRN